MVWIFFDFEICASFLNYKLDLDPKDDTLFVTMGVEGNMPMGIVTEEDQSGRTIIGTIFKILNFNGQVAGHWEYLVSRLADHRVIGTHCVNIT